MDCKIIDKDVELAESNFKLKVRDAVDKMIGTTEGKSKEFKELHAEVISWLDESGLLSRYAMDIDVSLNSIKEYMHTFFREDYFTKEGLLRHKYTPVAVLKRFRIMKKQVKKNAGRDIHSVMRSLLFPGIVAARYDRYGIIGKAVKRFESFTDSIQQKFNSHIDRIKNIYNDWESDLNEIYTTRLLNNDLVEPLKMWYDSITPIKDKKGNHIAIRKVLKGTGDRIESVVYSKVNEKDGSISKDTDVLNINDIASFEVDIRSDIKEAVKSSYRNRLINDLMVGEVRYIEFVPRYQYTKEERTRVERILSYHHKLLEAAKERGETGATRLPYRESIVDAKGVRWYYVMIKEREDRVPTHGLTEKHRAVFVQKEIDGKRINVFKTNFYPDLKSNEDLFKNNGFYRASKEDVFGETFDPTTGELNEKTKNRQLTDFKRMEVQPDKILGTTEYTDPDTGKRIRSMTEKMWMAIRQLRKEYGHGLILNLRKSKGEKTWRRKSFGNFEKGIGAIIQESYASQEERLTELFKEARELFGKELFEEILQDYGIENRGWIDDRDGSFHVAGGYFRAMTENYYPVQYYPDVYLEQIEKTIESIESRISELSKDSDQYKKGQETLEVLREIVGRYGRDGNTAMAVNIKTVFAKHRVDVPGILNRRKDGSVDSTYINKVSRVLTLNDRMITLLSSIIQIKKLYGDKVADSRIDYLLNRFKIMNGNPESKAYLFNFDISNTRTAQLFNKIPGVKNVTPQMAESLNKKINGILSSILLGTGSAFTNRFQVISGIIEYGYKYYTMAQSKLSKSNEREYKKWNDILNNTGIRNVIEMLNDITFIGGGSGDIFQEGFIGLMGRFPVKSIYRFGQLLMGGREKFISRLANGEGEDARGLRSYLLRWEYNRVQNALSASAKSTALVPEKRNIKVLAGLYYDLYAMRKKEGESQKKEIERITTAIKRLVPGIQDNRIRAAVSWKLSFWFEGLGGKEVFTFTGSEKAVRDEIAIMALLSADDMGTLAPYAEKGKSIYMSKHAINIARTAVYAHAFGMSPVYLPEAFSGLGRVLLQYKGYTLQETLLELKTLKAFTEGGSFGTNMMRLRKELNNIYTRKVIKREVPLEDMDPEALKLIRMLVYRGSVTAVSSMIGLIPFVNHLAFRNFEYLRMIRGLESPILAPFMRIFARMLFWSCFGGDDDDEDIGLVDISRLFLPPIISILIEPLIRD